MKYSAGRWNLLLKFSAITALTIVLASCGSTKATPTNSPTNTQTTSADVQKVLDDLEKIASDSQVKKDLDGLTETFYINNQGTQPFVDNGEMVSEALYDPGVKNCITLYESNPTSPQPGDCSGIMAIQVAQDAVNSYKPTDTTPTEKDGVFTFPGDPEMEYVVIVYTKDGLVAATKIQDYLDDPSFTNYYEINFYNIYNPIVDKIRMKPTE